MIPQLVEISRWSTTLKYMFNIVYYNPIIKLPCIYKGCSQPEIAQMQNYKIYNLFNFVFPVTETQ